MKRLTLVECAVVAKKHKMTYGQMQGLLLCKGLTWESHERIYDVESPFVRHVKEECRRIRRERGEDR